MGIQGIEYDDEQGRLEHLLKSVDRPGNYCVGGRLYTPMPRVVVDGAGELSFPIPDAQIRKLIAAAERAPHGRGTETLLDTTVRDCWQIDAARVRISGRAWPDSFARVMERVAAGLGLPADRLGTELYKLLVYRPGGFFAEHRDTEKVPGMVATLSLSLPARGKGGELVVRHGDTEEVFDLNAGEPSELSFAAFYADCPHEVRPLREGHRVTLVFNLFLGSSEDAPGAPDYSDLTEPVAECLARWREEGVTDKLVWLLDHEYSEGGLSFDALKNTDAAVAHVLGDAADRAGCELNAAVLRISETGSPLYEPPSRDWGWDWDWDEYEDPDSDAEMDEIHERWEGLDGWAARDGSNPPYGVIGLKDLELLPRGALDDAEPDDRRLEGSTGNEGPTLEFIYRLAALVIWPRDKTVDIVAGASIDLAVSWVDAQCDGLARAGDGRRGRITGLLGRLTLVWPVGKDAWRPQDRGAMLRLLRRVGEARIAVDFLHRVVMAGYNGTENEALAGILPVIGTEEAGDFLPRFVKEHLPRRFGGVVEMLVLAAAEGAGGGGAGRVEDPDLAAGWHVAMRQAVAIALSGLNSAFRAESEIRPDGDDDRPPEAVRLGRLAHPGRAPHDKWIDHGAVCGLMTLASRLGLDREAAAASEAIGDHPGIVTPDRMLPAALELMRKQRAFAETKAYGVLWRHAAEFLLERSSSVPAKPTDWTITADIPCRCDLCRKLIAFCDDPARRIEHFKVRKDLRKHLHRVIDRHRLDMHHVTKRQGRPFTLVCTKNRASYQRRLDEYAEDLHRMDSLLAGAPRIERREGGRVERLAGAVESPGHPGT